jgi:hypothetical protein
MVKKATVLFFFIAVMLQSFTHCLIVSVFKANQEYIARTLCINKQKPKLKCGGRCQLMKKMAAEQNDQKSNTLTLKISLLPFTVNESNEKLIPSQQSLIQHFTFYTASLMAVPPVDIFHPPLNG